MKVSIIIPVYNVAPYIEDCLQSVMRQTYEGSIECLIVDDCGTDGSISIVEKMVAAYKGPISFHILYHEHNRGLSAARNTGTEVANGEYVYYLDGDDEITPDCIEKLVAPITKDNSIEIVQGNYVWIKKAGTNPKAIISQSKEYEYITHESVLTCTTKDGHAWNKLIKKDFLQRYNLQFKEGVLWEDLLWDFYVSKHLGHFYYVPDVTYIHYRNPQSITTSMRREEKIQHYITIDDEIASNLTHGKEDEETLRYLSIFLKHFMVANGAPGYKNAYTLFHKALADGGHWNAKKKLETVHWISEHAVSRSLFEQSLKAYHLYQHICYG